MKYNKVSLAASALVFLHGAYYAHFYPNLANILAGGIINGIVIYALLRDKTPQKEKEK